jgi:YggT family protein
MAEYIVNRDSGSYMIARVVWAILAVVNVILGFRFILRILAANPAADFVAFVYNISAALMAPFANMVRNLRLDNGGVIEWSTLVAMAVYWLAAWAIVSLVSYVTSGPRYVERV